MKKLILTFSLAIFLVLFLSSCAASSPSATVRDFYNAVNKGDYNAATGYFSSRIIQSLSISKLQYAIQYQKQMLDAQGGIKSIDIADEQAYDTTAMVTVNLTYGNGQKTTEKVQLIKENGKWKIDMTK